MEKVVSSDENLDDIKLQEPTKSEQIPSLKLLDDQNKEHSEQIPSLKLLDDQNKELSEQI